MEIAEVLARPLPDERSAFLQALIDDGELVEITQPITACRDPKDDKFLELAVAGMATHLIRR